MRALLNLLDAPWWAIFVVLLGIPAILYSLRWYIQYRFEKMCHDAVLEAGSALEGAEVTVHSVKAVEPPTGPSPYDVQPDDEEFMEGVDGEPWETEGTNYYSIDVTIKPVGDGKWDPTGLAMVPADYEGEDEIDISENLCGIHSAEVFVNGQFKPAPEREVSGPLRVRLLVAVGEGLRELKFANLVTYFGHVDLPASLPKRSLAPSNF